MPDAHPAHAHHHDHGHSHGEAVNAAHDHGHGHDNGHDHGHGHGIDRNADRGGLWLALLITLSFTIVEIIGGWISGSLALLADAGHMFTDAAALALSLGAIWMARLPSTSRRTYGLLRAEILAALVNGVTLWVICGFIFYEAWQRVHAPPPIESGAMFIIALLGLLANAATFYVLWRSGGESLNLQGALLHVLGDLLGSVGAIGAALVIRFTGWQLADPIISVCIALLIVASAWRLLSETVRVLLEISPRHINPADVEAELRKLPGVAEVHDIHVWTITSGVDAVSGHLRLCDDAIDAKRLESIFQDAYRALAPFKIKHITLQIEPNHHEHPEKGSGACPLNPPGAGGA
ncbi:MAG TPA: cation diffusion facilitator family transporter [Planctomycetota bacterium]|nr:cation diffusion facilitator family transporter [Planctomycetota bacterium]